jgi:hypothetical protein
MLKPFLIADLFCGTGCSSDFRMLTHISLFSGIGCSDIASGWAGFKTVLMCEIDKDCQKVLNKHFPGVPIIEDIKDVTRESVIANTESHKDNQRERGSMAEEASGREGTNLSFSVSNKPFTNTSSIRCNGRESERVYASVIINNNGLPDHLISKDLIHTELLKSDSGVMLINEEWMNVGIGQVFVIKTVMVTFALGKPRRRLTAFLMSYKMGLYLRI